MSNDQVFRECGPGWNGLIDPLVRLANELGIDVTQIKEKFGRLILYWVTPIEDNYSDGKYAAFEERVQQAEDDSEHVCEMCGQPGVLMSHGIWLKTLCKEHSIELGYHRRAD